VLELCEGLRRGFYRSWFTCPVPRSAICASTLSPRRHLIRIQTAEVNAVKRLLRGVGLNRGLAAACARMLTGSALLAGDVVPEELKEHVRHQYAVRSQAAERVRALDLSLGESACGRREASNETVRGVDPIVALSAIVVSADGSRFEIAKHAAIYSGLVAGTFQSGERDAYCHVAKRGSAELRAMLCEAAHHASRLQRALCQDGARMLENGESIRARPHNAGGNRMRAMLREGGASCAKATRRACQDGARMLENGEAIGAPPHNAGEANGRDPQVTASACQDGARMLENGESIGAPPHNAGGEANGRDPQVTASACQDGARMLENETQLRGLRMVRGAETMAREFRRNV
jgi:hypothetical protein